jgi:hypothetical protein
MNRYISRYSNDKTVSAAQYITELICEKKAKINQEDLHYRFWLSKKWSMFFRNQIATANKLLSQYNSKAIIQALLDKKAEKIFSLRAPHLLAIIEEKEKLLKTTNNILTKGIDRKTNPVFKNNHNTSKNKNIISKLEDIDNVN